jgi:hypothetical protein
MGTAFVFTDRRSQSGCHLTTLYDTTALGTKGAMQTDAVRSQIPQFGLTAQFSGPEAMTIP